jgi:pimeloyl-ACP methyl ester carboxylesterase
MAVSGDAVRYLERDGGIRLAHVTVAGRPPTVVFLGGYASDMTGTKARYLDAWCRARGRAFVRFDYQGHGRSSGRLLDGTITAWRDDGLAILRAVTEGPLHLVGSSMGVWLALLCGLALPGRVGALVGLAAAPDFTEDLLWAGLDEAQRARLRADGVIHLPSRYGEAPLPFTWRLVEDGRRHRLLTGRIALACPVRLLHGMADPEVPWETSWRLAQMLDSADVTVTLVKGGGHRLSASHELRLLGATLDGLA